MTKLCVSYCAIKLKISAVIAMAGSQWCNKSPSIPCLHWFNRAVKDFLVACTLPHCFTGLFQYLVLGSMFVTSRK